MPTKARLLTREVLPHFLAFAALVAATLAIDVALHLLGAVWVGRYLGIPGVLLIAGSFAYSLRKRKLIKLGKPVALLRLHERMAWAGSLLVLVHAGIHIQRAPGLARRRGHDDQRGQRADRQVSVGALAPPTHGVPTTTARSGPVRWRGRRIACTGTA